MRQARVRWLLQFALAYVALTAAFSFFGPTYISLCSPLIRWGLQFVAQDLSIRTVTVDGNVLKVVFRQLGELGVPQGPNTTVRGAIQVLYTAPIMALSVLAAWPMRSAGRKLLSFLLALPLLACFPMVHFPTLLLTPMLGGTMGQSPAWVWFFFVSNGGTQLLALLVAWLSMIVANRVSDSSLTWLAQPTGPSDHTAGETRTMNRAQPDQGAVRVTEAGPRRRKPGANVRGGRSKAR